MIKNYTRLIEDAIKLAVNSAVSEGGYNWTVSKSGKSAVLAFGGDGFERAFNLENLCRMRPPWQHGCSKGECLAIAQSLRRLADRFEKNAGKYDAEYGHPTDDKPGKTGRK